MIGKISGKIIQKKGNSLLIDVNGLGYEVFIPHGIMNYLNFGREEIELITFHYYQTDSSKSIPVLIGFLNEIEKEFFEKIITVSGIGPKAAVRAINEPICAIARAIDAGDIDFLKALPGIGQQRAKEIIAKLQGKVGKFGLIKGQVDKQELMPEKVSICDEAVAVLLQLQYKKQEAQQMVNDTLQRNPEIQTSEELLNEVYRQKFKQD